MSSVYLGIWCAPASVLSRAMMSSFIPAPCQEAMSWGQDEAWVPSLMEHPREEAVAAWAASGDSPSKAS